MIEHELVSVMLALVDEIAYHGWPWYKRLWWNIYRRWNLKFRIWWVRYKSSYDYIKIKKGRLIVHRTTNICGYGFDMPFKNPIRLVKNAVWTATRK